MTASADTLILASLALVCFIIIGFIVSVWRGMRSRRSLRLAQQRLAQQGEQLTSLQDSLREDEVMLGQRDTQIQHLEQRLKERDDTLVQRLHEQREAATTLQSLQDDLSQLKAENRGQSVALEQTHSQHQQKNQELQQLQTQYSALQKELNGLQREHAQLQTQQAEREDRHQEQIRLLNDTRDNLKKDFENLANKIFEDKGKHFTATSQASLESLLKPFRDQITGFQTRINEVHSESLKGNTALEMEIKKVLEVGLSMNTQASNLATALKGDKKTTGNWGEAQLERTLELAGLQPDEHYATQTAFNDEAGQRRMPDFVIKLPDGKNLVIDSKVSLVDYDRAISADSDEARQEALAAHTDAVRNHINDLAKKDYANLQGIESPDFVLMFMPIEPAYIEAMKHNKDLFNFGYQKGVVMVSHTTLMPILRTVANLWMVERSNREAKDISNRAGEIYNQVSLVAERLHKLGNNLKTVNKQYNETVTGLAGKQGLIGKVDRFAQVSAKASREMPTLEPLHEEIESQRLENLGEEHSPATSGLLESDAKH